METTRKIVNEKLQFLNRFIDELSVIGMEDDIIRKEKKEEFISARNFWISLNEYLNGKPIGENDSIGFIIEQTLIRDFFHQYRQLISTRILNANIPRDAMQEHLRELRIAINEMIIQYGTYLGALKSIEI